MVRLMVSVFTCRDVHPIARSLSRDVQPRTGEVAVLREGLRSERQDAWFSVLCDQFFDALTLRVRLERFQVPLQQRGGRLGNQAVGQDRLDLQAFSLFAQREFEGGPLGRAAL